MFETKQDLQALVLPTVVLYAIPAESSGQDAKMWHPEKKIMLFKKSARGNPPYVVFAAHTVGVCVYRNNWPLGAVSTGSEGVLTP